jgi:hypothetical protein
MSDCVGNVKYYGLRLPFEFYISCHKCKSNGFIPFYFYFDDGTVQKLP